MVVAQLPARNTNKNINFSFLKYNLTLFTEAEDESYKKRRTEFSARGASPPDGRCQSSKVCGEHVGPVTAQGGSKPSN
jgi:hypothetical protein